MTENPFPGAGNLEIEVRRIDETWYAHMPKTALWGRASTLEGAVAHLSRQHADYGEFLLEYGTPPLDLLANRPAPRLWWSRIGPVVRLLVVIALCAIPVSYALSTGIERGVEAAARDLRLRGLLTTIEQGILDLAKPENDLPPERAEALAAAVRRIVDRLAPFTAPAGRLFESGARPPSDVPPADSN